MDWDWKSMNTSLLRAPLCGANIHARPTRSSLKARLRSEMVAPALDLPVPDLKISQMKFQSRLSLAPCIRVAVNFGLNSFFRLLSPTIFSWGLVQLLQLFSHNSVQLLLHISFMF